MAFALETGEKRRWRDFSIAARGRRGGVTKEELSTTSPIRGFEEEGKEILTSVVC